MPSPDGSDGAAFYQTDIILAILPASHTTDCLTAALISLLLSSGRRGIVCDMTETLLYKRSPDGIGTITFNRPDALNALDLKTMDRFRTVVAELSEDPDLRVVILTGAGDRAFCSGGDLHELANYPSEADAARMIGIMGDALLTLERLPVPVIAAINGYALGGGSEIAVACDIRIADDNVRMGFVQIRMAVTPGWGAGQRLMRLVGYQRAMYILLRGNPMRAHEVLAHGLVNEIVDRGTALNHALGFARRIANEPPDVVRGIKALLQAGINHPYEEALRIEREIFPPLWAADAHVRAVEDFMVRQGTRRSSSAVND